MAYNNELPTYESILEFQAVYFRAVALSWRNPEFESEFLEEPLVALSKWFGYSCPWNIDVKVTKPSEPPGGAKEFWDAKNKKWSLPLNKIILGMPEAPEVQDQGIALAAYNDSGPTYLFTCC